MRAILYATAALAALSPAAAHAAQPTPVDELIVTATRLATPVDLVTGARVIERVELEARQTPFATEVLSTVPGVGVARNGAFGGGCLCGYIPVEVVQTNAGKRGSNALKFGLNPVGMCRKFKHGTIDLLTHVRAPIKRNPQG